MKNTHSEVKQKAGSEFIKIQKDNKKKITVQKKKVP